MGFVIAIFVTLAVAGSIMWVAPSKRDLRLTRMRQKALEHGLKIRLLDEKLANSMFPWVDDYRAYVLYESHKIKLPKAQELVVYKTTDDSNTHELDKLRASYLSAELLSGDVGLPDSHEAVIVYPSGVGVLWREQGDVAEVEMIASAIIKIAELLGDEAKTPRLNR